MNQNSDRSEAFQGAADNALADASDDRYCGFSLQDVTWGYRDIFARAIEELFEQGLLGTQHQEVTARFFALLKQADRSCFDHVLRRFLGALSPRNRWIMELPGVFTDLVELGCILAQSKVQYGIRFFETLGAGGMGDTPQDVRACLGIVRRLRGTDEELAMAFLAGYGQLCRRLRPLELERYLEVALRIHCGNREAGYRFLRGELPTSETYILAITRECRLSDVAEPLRAMIKALTGSNCTIDNLSRLDADDLNERGTVTLSVTDHVYLPERFRHFDTARANRNWYLLCGIATAAMLLDDAFPRVHGLRQYRTCAELAGRDVWRQNLFQILEYVRVLRHTCRRWPGARRLVDWGVRTEFGRGPGRNGPEQLVADAMDAECHAAPVALLRRVADDCVNCFDSAQRLEEPWAQNVLAAYPDMTTRSLPPSRFLSDFLFPIGFSDRSRDQLVADLKQSADRHHKYEGNDTPPTASGEEAGSNHASGNKAPIDTANAAFVYDEWDFRQNDYRSGWCHVHQQRVAPAASPQLRADWLEQARKVQAVFERLKPDIARKEKRLSDGDHIDADLLVTYLVERRREPAPPVRFYEKPAIKHRDLAVLVLLDVSGSTGESIEDQAKVLDIEKQAAFILGQGLNALGDRFAVCGFSSNGRQQCEYLLFKSFDEPWSGDSIARIMAAWPRSSTRIGPALRHSGHLLDMQPNRQRLIILVTDGKPMDQDYDPNTRYAQHDVRMACEENVRRGIHTFAISTEENSLADMEIMFPRRRFVILPGIRQLPHLLPELYLRLTW